MVLRQQLFVLLALLPPFSVVAHAQWLNYPTPGTPRTRDGKPNLTAPAPRTTNGKPDLSGVWHVEPTPLAELKRIFGGFIDATAPLSVPGMGADNVNKYFISVLADFKPQEMPLRPEALAFLRAHESVDGPEKVCLPGGPVTPYIPDPHKIVQTPNEIVIMYEADGSHRQIYTDGRGLPKEIIQPSWQGYSAAQWDGDTLVVETAGFNDRTRLDLLGHPHSEALRVVEHYKRRDFGHMDAEMTFNDPQYYTKPFTIRYTEELLPDTDVLEYVCNENEKDSVHVGKK
ncbi:MAG: hypothetical protein WBE37_05580 [Bryobacteraceae bacterium]